MSKERLYIFDTTLRDGAQTQGVHFSIDEKTKIAHALDSLGVDYIEGGWPGANPSDTEFFQKALNLKSSKFTAFGMTKKSGRSAENDPGLSAIMNSNTKSVCLVGKTWDFHVDVALGISKEENIENIKDTTKHFEKIQYLMDLPQASHLRYNRHLNYLMHEQFLFFHPLRNVHPEFEHHLSMLYRKYIICLCSFKFPKCCTIFIFY